MNHYSKVLILSAHPDDLEISCGGTVAKFVDEGTKVDNIILCSNVKHKKYVASSSKILGYSPIYLNHRDESPTSNVISEIEKKTVDKNVINFEPNQALFVKDAPIYFYKTIFN